RVSPISSFHWCHLFRVFWLRHLLLTSLCALADNSEAAYWTLVQYRKFGFFVKKRQEICYCHITKGAQTSTLRENERFIMNSTTISLIVFACVFGGALLGIFLHAVLPQHHLAPDSKDIVKLGVGLVGTMAALVLGLLVASAKGSYDNQNTELTQMSANIALLDRGLALYGPETKETRAVLRGAVVRILDQMWSKDGAGSSPMAAPSGGEILYEKIQGLSPKNDTQ